MIRIASIAKESIVDGPGFRFVVFVQGCKKRCHGCHNPSTHDMGGGYLMDKSEILAMICENPLLDGVTLSGGEPFLQPIELSELAKECQQRGLDVVTYTGYRWEELHNIEGSDKLLAHTDYLVDGEYESAKRSLELRFRGSSGQRVIDVAKSQKERAIRLINWDKPANAESR